jgi:hypothetical protein
MKFRIPVALLTALIVCVVAMPAAAQGVTGTACTTPFDPACNHLKCYQIKDKPSTIVSKSPVLQLDNQFGREVVYRLQPVLLCVPTQKSCCCPGSPGCVAGATGCSVNNCAPNPVPAPALPHFKCYKIKAKTCPNGDCATLASSAAVLKGTLVNLRDQFGQELNVPVGNPKLICAPADKQVVGHTTSTTTTTTTTTITQTTTTTIICHFDSNPAVNGCVGPCPPTAPAGAQCQLTGPGKCDCVLPPVCCECPGVPCFNTNGQCPAACTATANSTCNTTGHCGCGFCRDAASCTNIPCSTSSPCPSTGLACDPINCPAPCDPCAGQPAPCGQQCLRPDGTSGQCRQAPGQTSCSCCGPTGAFCTTDFDCCSFICNVSTNSCQ